MDTPYAALSTPVFDNLLAGKFRSAISHLQVADVGPGDVVLLQAQQCAEAMALFWACMALGAVFVPLDASWPPYLVQRSAGHLESKFVVARSDMLEALGGIFPTAKAIDLDRIGEGADSAAPQHEGVTFPASQAAVYLFTSGSTGTPKAVVLSRGALAHGAALTLKTFGWERGDRLLNMPELHTMSGLRNALVAAPIGGLVWIPSPTEARTNIVELVEHLAESRCDHLVAGPSLIRQLVLMGNRIGENVFASLKAIYCTGASINPSAVEAFHSRFGIPVVNYYGLTETGGICISQDRRNWDPRDRSLGRAVGCSARLIDGAKTSTEGELQIRSPQLMSGYLGDPDRTRARFDGDWLKTGDVMRQDEEGNFYLLGRSDLFIKTANTDRIHPEELETVLEGHEAVSEAAVTAQTTTDGSERVVALVVLHDTERGENALALALARFTVELLGPSRGPNDIVFVDSLPRLAGGKLARGKLGELLN